MSCANHAQPRQIQEWNDYLYFVVKGYLCENVHVYEVVRQAR